MRTYIEKLIDSYFEGSKSDDSERGVSASEGSESKHGISASGNISSSKDLS